MNNYLYKIIIAFSFLFIIISNSNSNEIDCNNFEKLSAKYIECNTNKLKKKVNENFKSSKKNIEESELTKKLKKFKNSKTLSDLGEN